MKIKEMPAEAKAYKWIVAMEYKGETYFVNAWNDFECARTQALCGGYKVYPIESVK